VDERRLVRARLWFFRVWAAIGVLALLYVVARALAEPLKIVLPPLFLAGALVYMLNPVVRGLNRRGVPRLAGSAVAYLCLLGVIALAISLLGPRLVNQVKEFADAVPDMAVDIRTTGNRFLSSIGVDARIPNINPESEAVQRAITDFLSGNTGGVRGLLAGAGTVLRQALHVVLTVILGPILAFYLLVDLPRLGESIRRLIPPSHRDEVADVATRIGSTVGAYFRGQLMVATFVAIATSVGLLIVGLPFWALVGVLTGIFNLVPLVGPFVGGIIGVLVAFTVGDGVSQALWVTVVMVVVQQVDNHIISPNVMSRTVSIHPVTVMLALLVAGTMFGIFGMFVVIPLLATVKLILLHIFTTRVGYAAQEAAADAEAEAAAAEDAEEATGTPTPLVARQGAAGLVDALVEGPPAVDGAPSSPAPRPRPRKKAAPPR